MDLKDSNLWCESCEQVEMWMDGWMDKGMDGWVDGWMDGWTMKDVVNVRLRLKWKLEENKKKESIDSNDEYT